MKITEKTKISELIKADKNCIDAISSVAEPLKKLHNPILRKIMASRVTIAEAAKMGGTTVEAIVKAITPLGFEFETGNSSETKQEAFRETKPSWLLNAAENTIIHYDVRPILESGTDPLKAILGKFKEVPAGYILCIINSFVPTPLIHLLKQEKAEDSFIDTISQTEFHTYFLKKQAESKIQSEKTEKVIMDDESSFNLQLNSYLPDKIKEIDVRNMEMPMPMQTILGELEELSFGTILFVHHKRVPLYLLEELADKNFEVHINTIDENYVKLIILEKK